MPRQQYEHDSFLGLFKGIHKTVLTMLVALILSSGGIYAVIGFIDFRISSLPENSLEKTSWKNNVKPILSDISSSLISTVVIILFFEIGLRKATIKEIRNIYKETQPSKYISNFYASNKESNDQIVENIKIATPGSDIKLLGFEKEINMLDSLGIKIVKNQIISGCHFRIIISHPESSLLECLEKVNSSNKTLLKAYIASTLKNLYTELYNNLSSLKGTIEVRLHENVFAPVCYYCGPGLASVWMYLPAQEGTEFPGFIVSNQELINDMNNYFEHLWKKSSYVLFKVSKDDSSSMGLDSLIQQSNSPATQNQAIPSASPPTTGQQNSNP
ncbi:hypothetical protein [Scytonema sp. NUACC26]|uniref:hypothetical protein n=1 Tax=Scytonema sp. NUACC26 TaxID=3140176 RepID=UPI0034DBC4A4